MIRAVQLNINYATKQKKELLSLVMEEYKRVVNLFIEQYWKDDKLNKFSEIEMETGLSLRLQQCALKQAIEIIKSVRVKEKDRRFNRYKKVYKYFLNKNRQLKFLSKRYSELNLKYHTKPKLKQDVINLDERFIELQESKDSTFDLWIKLSSLGNKIIVLLPSKKHKLYHKYKGWNLLKSGQLVRKDNKFYVNIFFEKENEEPIGSKDLAIDVGINNLLSLSNDERLGKEFKQLLIKLNNKVQKSKSWYRTLNEIKNYIGQQVNRLDLSDIRTLVLEDLKYIQINTKQEHRVNKTTRKYLSKWNLGLVHSRIKNKCEVSRTNLAFIQPQYSSQACPSCKTIDKRNRVGEKFKCIKCGHEDHADNNAAKVHLLRFHQELIVSDLKRSSVA